MKSPTRMSAALARQWQSAERRETVLLTDDGTWPMELSIGRPLANVIASDLDGIRRHMEQWRQEKIGTVEWECSHFRSVAEPVAVPVRWSLASCAEWVAACRDTVVQIEYDVLIALLEQVDPQFHNLLTRRRVLWRGRDVAEIVRTCQTALELEPGSACGKPLRACVAAGVDTKFFERNHRLLIALLDIRFDGDASHLGLEDFLGAVRETDHWLLIADLDGSLLPFKRQRVRAFELRTTSLPGRRVLIVENEQCLHQLPQLDGTVAVLGAGLDVVWADAQWLQERQVAYWGDIDTWGLKCLAGARARLPLLRALLMTGDVFDEHYEFAVKEAVNAGLAVPNELLVNEQRLYQRLLCEDNGRLEQELIPASHVELALQDWATSS